MAQEKNFQNYVKSFLKDNNCYTIVTHGDGLSKRGIPDIITCYNGCFLGIELKANNGRPSALQLENLRQINNSGGYGILLYKSGFDNFVKFISALGNTNKAKNYLIQLQEKDTYLLFK